MVDNAMILINKNRRLPLEAACPLLFMGNKSFMQPQSVLVFLLDVL